MNRFNNNPQKCGKPPPLKPKNCNYERMLDKLNNFGSDP